MSGEQRVGAVILLLLVLLAYVVPYTLLSGVRAWYGSFLFWVLFAVAAVGVVAWLTRSWAARPHAADGETSSGERDRQ
ncbi:MAG: hypothetical protein AB1609_01255 [Bacillota bacterium]